MAADAILKIGFYAITHRSIVRFRKYFRNVTISINEQEVVDLCVTFEIR